MEPSIPTEEFERARRPSPPADATIEMRSQSAQPPRRASVEPSRPAVSSAGAHCAACGAPLAPDQRYCVECGQRRGPTRPPFLEHVAQLQQASSSSPPPPRRKPRIHPNTALIAGIGTLMLAMATGVLIGRTSAPSSKGVPVQYIGAPTSSAPNVTSTPSSTEGGGSGKAGGGGGHNLGKASPSSVAAKILKGKAPPKAVVKVGTPGKGPGYQKGHFTGKFFGGNESKKQEEEEELGE